MPKFFFQVDDGTPCADEEGTDYPSVAAAQCAAVEYAGNLIREQASKFWNSGEWNMTVTTDTGLSLFALQFIGTESPSIRAVRRFHS